VIHSKLELHIKVVINKSFQSTHKSMAICSTFYRTSAASSIFISSSLLSLRLSADSVSRSSRLEEEMRVLGIKDVRLAGMLACSRLVLSPVPLKTYLPETMVPENPDSLAMSYKCLM
jgi:hypothetical protein